MTLVILHGFVSLFQTMVDTLAINYYVTIRFHIDRLIYIMLSRADAKHCLFSTLIMGVLVLHRFEAAHTWTPLARTDCKHLTSLLHDVLANKCISNAVSMIDYHIINVII